MRAVNEKKKSLFSNNIMEDQRKRTKCTLSNSQNLFHFERLNFVKNVGCADSLEYFMQRFFATIFFTVTPKNLEFSFLIK